MAPVDHMEMAHFANRAEWLVQFHDEDCYGGWRQELPTALDHHFSTAVGKESKMPDLDEPARQDMQEEPSDELHRFQCHLFRLIAVLRISPAEADAAILQAQQSSVGNGDTMGVSSQIPQNLFWPAERRLGIDDPFLVLQRRQLFLKADRVGEFPDAPVEFQAIFSKCLFQVGKQLAAKQIPQRGHRQKELLLSRTDPSLRVQ